MKVYEHTNLPTTNLPLYQLPNLRLLGQTFTSPDLREDCHGLLQVRHSLLGLPIGMQQIRQVVEQSGLAVAISVRNSCS